MPSLSDAIVLVHPTVSGVSVLTTSNIWVLFDREMDETTVGAGCFFVTGPDFDTWIGPDLQIFNEAESSGSGSDDILESPGFEGLLQGQFSFEKISLSEDMGGPASPTVVTGVYDTVGSGFLWRTKAIFTPTNRLQADTTYTVHITGDEDEADTLGTGLSSRTVFDTVTSGTNTTAGSYPVTSSGYVNFAGGYAGSYDDTFRLKITTAGEIGTAKFTFVRDSDPFSIFGPFKLRRSGVLLSDCVTVEFAEAEYSLGDQWSVVVKAKEIFTGNVLYPFETGSGSIVALPTTTSTTVLGDIPTPATISSTDVDASFTVSSTLPTDNATNLYITPGPYTIKATFNGSVNAATVQSGVNVIVTAQDVEGEGYATTLDADPSVSGTVLSIILNSGVLSNNQLISITLGSSIADVSGTYMSSDYEWSFTTTYSPMYSTLRRIRLSIGNFIQYVPDDTVNFSIYMASLMADELTWNADYTDDTYYQFVRQQWAHCKAEELLLMNTIGGSGNLKAKTLGDLRVEYATSANNMPALDRAIQCQQKWEGALQAGGRQVQTASYVVKGQYDPDRPPVGRGWAHTRSLDVGATPAVNKKTLYSGYRRYYSRYAKGWWSK